MPSKKSTRPDFESPIPAASKHIDSDVQSVESIELSNSVDCQGSVSHIHDFFDAEIKHELVPEAFELSLAQMNLDGKTQFLPLTADSLEWVSHRTLLERSDRMAPDLDAQLKLSCKSRVSESALSSLTVSGEIDQKSSTSTKTTQSRKSLEVAGPTVVTDEFLKAFHASEKKSNPQDLTPTASMQSSASMGAIIPESTELPSIPTSRLNSLLARISSFKTV